MSKYNCGFCSKAISKVKWVDGWTCDECKFINKITGSRMYVTGTGQKITVHEENPDCSLGCVIHAPSKHSMNKFPTHWRSNRGMERICPHGVGHPDPDEADFINRSGGKPDLTHGCCGCCDKCYKRL